MPAPFRFILRLALVATALVRVRREQPGALISNRCRRRASSDAAAPSLPAGSSALEPGRPRRRRPRRWNPGRRSCRPGLHRRRRKQSRCQDLSAAAAARSMVFMVSFLRVVLLPTRGETQLFADDHRVARGCGPRSEMVHTASPCPAAGFTRPGNPRRPCARIWIPRIVAVLQGGDRVLIRAERERRECKPVHNGAGVLQTVRTSPGRRPARTWRRGTARRRDCAIGQSRGGARTALRGNFQGTRSWRVSPRSCRAASYTRSGALCCHRPHRAFH